MTTGSMFASMGLSRLWSLIWKSLALESTRKSGLMMEIPLEGVPITTRLFWVDFYYLGSITIDLLIGFVVRY